MTTLELGSFLGSVGCFLGGAAAWWSYVRPRHHARKAARAEAARAAQAQADEDRRYRRETHEALYGRPQWLDDSGALIRDPTPGLIAQMRALQAQPLLNGSARQLLDDVAQTKADVAQVRADVARVKADAAQTKGRLTRIERKLDTASVPEQREQA